MPIHPGDSERRARLANALRRQVPPPPPGAGPPRRPQGLEVFAVGVHHVQLTWRVLGPGPVLVRAGDLEAHVDADGGPGALTLSDLPGGSDVRIELRGPGLGGHQPWMLATRTLPHPGGELLHRIATVSDVHLGSRATGYFHTIIEKPAPAVPHPLRCFGAAVDEARTWGAAELVVKGDLVDASTPENWADAQQVLGTLELPVRLLPGNHEWSRRGDGDPARHAAAMGRQLVERLASYDVPGLRVVLVDTALPGTNRGTVAGLTDDVAEAAAGASTPVLVAMHQQPMRTSFPTYLPVGIPGPEAKRFLSTLGRANPRALVTSGHTHRHRRRRHGPVTVSEVGSPKDYPGTWAGYEVYEGGLVQVVHRIERPDCIRWTEHTRRAAAGVWKHWAPGRLDDRCFALSGADLGRTLAEHRR